MLRVLKKKGIKANFLGFENSCLSSMSNTSSNINEVIRAVLNSFFFFTKRFCTHQNSPKSTKSTKSTKKHQKHQKPRKAPKTTKNTKSTKKHKNSTKQKHKNANKQTKNKKCN